MPTLLINRADIAQYVQISDTVYDNILNKFILQAQFADVQRLLGADFYNDLIRNNTDVNYQTLLNGGDYTYNGTTYTNEGLKAVIVHYFESRYKISGSNVDTPFGLVVKTDQNSTNVDLASRKTEAKIAENMAFNYWENVKLFLDRNASDYPLWEQNCTTYNKSRFKVSKIGGGSSRRGSIASRFKYNND